MHLRKHWEKHISKTSEKPTKTTKMAIQDFKNGKALFHAHFLETLEKQTTIKKVQFGKKHNIRKILANTQINTNTMLDEKKLQTLEQSAVITGVEEMCYLASRCWGDVLSTKMLRGCGVMQTGVESMRYQANRCWGDGQANQCWGCWGGVLSRKPVLRGCVIEQTNLKEMRYHANRCWGDALSNNPVLRRCVITQSRLEGVWYQANRRWGDVLSCKLVLRVCDIKQTGVEEMRHMLAGVVGMRCQANQCWGGWGGVLSCKPVLRGCGIQQTNVKAKEMCHHANRCWGEAANRCWGDVSWKPVLEWCATMHTGVEGMRYLANSVQGCVIKQSGVKGMCHQTSQRWGDGSSGKPCWGYALSSKPVLRGCVSSSKLVLRRCGIKQTGVDGMRYQAKRCWEHVLSRKLLVRGWVIKRTGVEEMC